MTRFSNSGRTSPMGAFSIFPPVLKALLIINIVIFLLDASFFEIFKIGDTKISYYFTRWFALFPFGSGLFWPWQLITYQFMHGGLGHIFFNMLALWMFGSELETLWGSRRFLTFYLLAGIGGGLIHLLVQYFVYGNVREIPTVGASGAIYGILAGFAMSFPDRPIMMFPFFIPIPAKYFVLIMGAIGLYSGASGSDAGVAHFAHLGGGLIGFLLVKFGDQLGVYALGDKIAGIFSKRARQINSFSEPVRRNPLKMVHHEERAPKRTAGGERTYDFEGSEITQAQVDEILDKINQVGYQSLTAREKNILFEVSKRLD
ncbi:MAG: rhomboid family intramembrane serine protease [Bacteroidota bacterium]